MNEILDAIDRWLERGVAPHVMKLEHDDVWPAEMVKQMQELLYYDAPYLVTAYSTVGEAWRTDRVACMQPQPDPGGIYLIQYGVHNYVNMRPASEADECAGEGLTEASSPTDEDAISPGLLIGGGVVLLLLLGVGAVVMVRRRSTVGDRE